MGSEIRCPFTYVCASPTGAMLTVPPRLLMVLRGQRHAVTEGARGQAGGAGRACEGFSFGARVHTDADNAVAFPLPAHHVTFG